MGKTADDRRTMVKVAKLYYFEGMTQAQIAKIIGVSRPIISKLLTQARETKVVEIYIKDEYAHTVDVELQLEKRYGLNEVIIVPNKDLNEELTRKTLGKAAASHISKKAGSLSSIGVSWGKSVAAFVEEYPFERQDSLHVVPLIGGMGRSHLQLHSNMLALKLGEKLSSSCSYLYAPAMMENMKLKEQLLSFDDISHVLDEGRDVDIAVVGLGNPSVNSTMEEIGYLSSDDIQSLIDSGAVGDINSRFYDVKGEPIDHSLNDMIIALSLEDLKRIPETVAIVQGVDKAISIHAGLLNGAVNTLITDDETGRELLKYGDKLGLGR
ncbi:sugar-binding transcriptional regulator [Paenalkalicoccus suaedae]|uniref:Sugar-binding transcriptional regulator n=1 Tax=Paenalkalicoccus suaedae TaxID=2592382 RepID=A0A859FH49_9BACI|nr:sugar-binding transcriptional regulator [Paenalkalicoccus suaedae]QKS72457.1 sugar-binding transcriptional regulator [Paenalkalicoccus suaedae]